MHATVENIEHGYRQGLGCGPAEIAVQRDPLCPGLGLGHGQRNSQNGIGAEFALTRGAIQLNHESVDRRLVPRLLAPQTRRQDPIHVLHRLGNALSQETLATIS